MALAMTCVGLLTCLLPRMACKAEPAAAPAEGPPASVEPKPPTLLRITDYGNDVHRTMTKACVEALQTLAKREGVATEFHDKPLEDPAPEGTVDVVVASTPTTFVRYINDTHGLMVVSEMAVFPNPQRFAAFLRSDLYRQLLDSAAEPDSIFPDRLLALAYGSTAQIFTRDKAITAPADLRHRTQIGLFQIWWYADIHEELGIGHDPVLGWTQPNIADQREALVKGAAKYDPDKMFVVMPILLALRIIPPELRKYVNLTMTQEALVSFIGAGWYRVDEARRAYVTRLGRTAAMTCSGRNFAAERDALTSLEASGSTIVPVPVAPFQAFSKVLLDREISKAEAELRRKQAEPPPKDSTVEENSSSERVQLEGAKERGKTYDAIQSLN